MLSSHFLCRIIERFISEGFRLSKVNNFVAPSKFFFEIGLYFPVPGSEECSY